MCSEVESDSETPMCVQKLRAIVRQKLALMDLVTQDSKGSTEESSHILQYLFVISSTMLPKRQDVQRNPAIFFNICLCHIIHNAAQKPGEAFNDVQI